MFREMKMSLDKGEQELIIRALCDKLSDVESNELPPLVHQLLRLCSNQGVRLLLSSLQKYFAKKYLEAGDTQSTESYEEIGNLK